MTLQIPQTPPLFSTSLAAQLGINDVAATLASPLMLNGVALTGLVSCSIDIGQPNPEYVVGTLAGNVLTFIVRGCDPLAPMTSDPSQISLHRLGAIVTITDYISIGMMVNILNGVTPINNIISYLTHPNFTPQSTQIPDVEYVYEQDQVIIQQLEAYVAQLIAAGGGGSRPLSFATFTLNNYDVPKVGYIPTAVTFNYQTAANGGNFSIQTPTENMQLRHYVTDWASATDIVSFVVIASTLYLLLTDGTNYRVYQYDVTNIAGGGTLCTGITLGTHAGLAMTSDGANLYFNYNSGTTALDYSIDRYTASGSVLAFVSTTNLGSTPGVSLLFLVDASDNYYGFDSEFVLRQYNSSGVLQQTTDPYQISGKILNFGDSIYGISTNADQYVLIDVVGTNDSFAIGTAVTEVANMDLNLGNTVGVAPFVGGVAFADMPSIDFASLLPDAIDEGPNGYQITWIGADSFFLLYKVSGATTLKGVVGTINRHTMTVSLGTAHTYTTTLYTAAENVFALCSFGPGVVGIFAVQSGANTHLLLDVSTISGSTITPSGFQAFSTNAHNIISLAAVGMSATSGVVYTGEGTTYNPLYTGFTITGTTINVIGTPVAGALTSAGVVYKIIVSNKALNGFTAFENSNNTIQSGTLTGSTVIVGLAITSPANLGVTSLLYCQDIIYLSDGKLGIGYFDGTGEVDYINILTVTGNAVAITGTPVSGGNFLAPCGIGSIDATTALLAVDVGGGDPAWQVYNMAGASPVLQYVIDNGSNAPQFTISAFLNMNGYFIIFNVFNYGGGSLGNPDNKLFIEGMTIEGNSFIGIVEKAVTLGSKTIVLIKGEDIHQSGLYDGQHYAPNGSGGVTPNGNGPMTANSGVSVIL